MRYTPNIDVYSVLRLTQMRFHSLHLEPNQRSLMSFKHVYSCSRTLSLAKALCAALSSPKSICKRLMLLSIVWLPPFGPTKLIIDKSVHEYSVLNLQTQPRACQAVVPAHRSLGIHCFDDHLAAYMSYQQYRINRWEMLSHPNPKRRFQHPETTIRSHQVEYIRFEFIFTRVFFYRADNSSCRSQLQSWSPGFMRRRFRRAGKY